MPLNVLLLGPQGAGKGTQAKRIAAEYGIPHIASGEILRAEMQAGTALGLRVKDVYDRGDLVSDDLMIELIRTRLGSRHRVGFILDGFPRTTVQAEALDTMFTTSAALQRRLRAADSRRGRLRAAAHGAPSSRAARTTPTTRSVGGSRTTTARRSR
jgi:adenylate kinase family enzyme